MMRAVLFLCFAATAFGAAPAVVDREMIFVESGRTTVRSNYQNGVILQRDGTFRGLFSAGTDLGQSVFHTSVPPDDGRWTYRRTGEQAAQLTLTRNSDPTRPETFSLVFTTEATGEILDGSLARFARTFRLREAAVVAPLLNASLRTWVEPGRRALAGFVIAGNASRVVLVRAVGRGLAAFGVPNALADPALRLQRSGITQAENDQWDDATRFVGTESVRRTSVVAGAFPLEAGSRDAALVVELVPGAYVAEVRSADASAGEVLVEVYLLP
jgi:hypothetical protein